IGLPFLALKLLFTRPRLLAWGVFPGAFTMAASLGLVWSLWDHLRDGRSIWLVVPVLVISFLALWLVIGKLALLPVEDAIINECQRALWGEVRLPSPPLTMKRLARDATMSTFLGLVSVVLLALEFVPALMPIDFIFLSWVTAYSFLSTIYARRVASPTGRVTLFFGHPVSHFLLGAFLNILLFVPVLDVFLLGYAQVLASLVYFRQEEPNRLG
ncbi:MAG: EI24 domain-containing protein, partial [Bdellovibrionota bacterium]